MLIHVIVLISTVPQPFRVAKAANGCGSERSQRTTWADEKWAVLANFEVDDLAFSVARRFCDDGRRNARALLAEGRIKSKIKSKRRSRSGAVERLSVGGRRDGPPLALG